MNKIFIGTSGWHYLHWRGSFYPEKFSPEKFLSYYLQYFSTVEINRTFYSVPEKSVFQKYAKLTPSKFIFSVKSSRFITHVKRLKDPKKPLKYFFDRVKGLKNHLGPILFLLPPHWNVNIRRLESFLKALPKGYRYTFEFRDHRWLNEETYQLLIKYNAAFCISEFDYFTTPLKITADFVYIRLHGPAGAYRGNYSLKALKKWAAFIRKQVKEGRDVYCYFDNDQAGFAAKNALTLKELLSE